MSDNEKLITPERVPEFVRLYTNVAYLMGAVTDHLMQNAGFYIEKAGFAVKQSTKKRLKLAIDTTNMAQRAWGMFAKEIYDSAEEREYLMNDVKWFADLVIIAADRAGDNPKRREMVRNALLRMRSELNIYKSKPNNNEKV